MGQRRMSKDRREQRARVLSRELREGHAPALRRRRGIVGLALFAAGAMGIMTLYQLGIIEHVPEPNLPKIDSDRVNGSAQAYEHFATPDAALGFGSYAATMVLAAMGGADRARTRPWIPLALAAKVGFDVVQATRLTVSEWSAFRALCFWCLTATAATVATVPLVVPETRAALRQLTM
ncbi:MAG TPA: vitamin K epoxide reductase family protein [Gemmatimonadaceae bacterium]|nr:vitamin K epoxide reductase family protein [Gemmatimonadaceae bacterium]